MKRNWYIGVLFIWSFIEYIVYSIVSIGTCYFNFMISDYSYILHFITNILLEIGGLYWFKKNKSTKWVIVLHFALFIVLFPIIVGNYFKNLPEACSIHALRKVE